MDMQIYSRWQEDQLREEISGLNGRIAKNADKGDPEERCVHSYLKQLVKDKRDKLATLRYQRAHA